MRPRNWKRHQHFKDRRPPWIRFYRDLLDDEDWHGLDGTAAKILTMLWLLASEDETLQGRLPTSVKKLCFRLRITEAIFIKHFPSIAPWLECPVITMISTRYQLVPPETETETETEHTLSADRRPRAFSEEAFAELWKAHPYGSKKDAREAYRKARGNGAPPDADLIVILKRQVQERKDADASGEFCARLPHLCRWFTHHRWEDAPVGQVADHGTVPVRRELTEEEREEIRKVC